MQADEVAAVITSARQMQNTHDRQRVQLYEECNGNQGKSRVRQQSHDCLLKTIELMEAI